MRKALAQAQREHAEATAAHQAAEARVQTILDKLDSARFQRDDVSQKRITSGTADPASDRAYAALAGDITVLERMLMESREELKGPAENLRNASVLVVSVKTAYDNQQAQAEYAATLAKTREIEAVFCKALRATALAGKRVGLMTLGGSFQKSATLRAALDLNQIPPEAA